MDAIQGTDTKQILRKYEFKLADLEILRDKSVLYARKLSKYDIPMLTVGTIVKMSDCLAWPYMKNVLSLFTKKLELWAYPEICDLMKLKGVDGTRARYFIERGITTLQELAIADLTNVERILRQAVPFTIDSNGNGDQNEWLMNEQIESCREAARLLIERAQHLSPIVQEALFDESILVNKTSQMDEFVEISESVEEIDQLDQNIGFDATMESLNEVTAELSIIGTSSWSDFRT